uniref:Protein kinase domain-containing protein n=1 Tax=Panagrolaimus sp. PS1159 TaxID=55785 RepID=A0AC35FRD5_9BILA
MRTEATTTNELIEPQGLVFKPGQKFGDWRIISKLDEGGFGQVYKVQNSKNPKKLAALKAEPNDVEGGSAIKLEITVLLLLNRNGELPHIPIVYHSAKRKRFCYMVITLLGPNLKALKAESINDKFSVSTWSRIGIQALYSLKLLHDSGFVHRDIKPANFAMGHPDDGERARIVHLLDFGLSRSYAVERVKGQWIPRRARGTAEFRGTARYCSPYVHEKFEQGRKDDLWALLYILIEFNFGLPWQKERDRHKLEVRKLNIPDDILLKNFPEEMHAIVPHLRHLNMYNRPDYLLIYNCFLKLLEKYKVKYSDKYDWETDEQFSKLRHSKPAAYEDATDFFKSDPVAINEPPLPGQSTKSTATMDDIDNMLKRAKNNEK